MFYIIQKLATQFQNWFHDRYYLTIESLGVTGMVTLIWAFSYYLMSVFSNIASSRSPDNTVYPQLPDIGFAVLPQLNTLWLTDLFDVIFVLPTIVLILTHRKPAYVGITWMLTSTLCNIERVTSVAVTSFPDPRPGCEKVSDNFFGKIAAHKCGDCMFSGHTVLFVICACAWTTHLPIRRSFSRVFIILLIWCFVIAGSAIVIMNRAHYTVDVLIACYVGIGNWYIVQFLWKEHCIRKGYLRSINWPEQRFLSPPLISSLEGKLTRYHILIHPDHHNSNNNYNDNYTNTILMDEKHNYLSNQQRSTIIGSRTSTISRNSTTGVTNTSNCFKDNLCNIYCADDKTLLSHYCSQKTINDISFVASMVTSLDIEQQQKQ